MTEMHAELINYQPVLGTHVGKLTGNLCTFHDGVAVRSARTVYAIRGMNIPCTVEVDYDPIHGLEIKVTVV